MGSGSNWYQIRNKTLPKVNNFFVVKKISMLTGLKVSPVTCKCVFYRPEHNIKGDLMELNFEVLQMQK